jgi:hypothetical protein
MESRMKAIEYLCLIVVVLVVILIHMASLPGWPGNESGGLFGSDGATKSRDTVTYTQLDPCNCSYQDQDIDTLLDEYYNGSAGWAVGKDGFFYDCCNRTVMYKNGSAWEERRIDVR